MLLRQGDVLLTKIEESPHLAENARTKVEPAERGYVLAEGEVTGHAHVIEALPEVELFTIGDVLYVRTLDAPAKLVHEEHAPIDLEPNSLYQVTRQREWTDDDEARYVAD
jgi:hypothetical protein